MKKKPAPLRKARRPRHKAFSAEDREDFVRYGISLSFAERFDSRFTSDDILFFCDDDIRPEVANAFPRELDVHDVLSLIDAGLDGKQARKFSRNFSCDDILYLKKHDVLPSWANRYSRRFNIDDIVLLHDEEILPRRANAYDARFDSRDIVGMVDARSSANKANLYSERFDGYSIAHLCPARISPEDAELYDERFDGLEIALLWSIGLRPGNMTRKLGDKLLAVFREMFSYYWNKEVYSEDEDFWDKIRIIGTGCFGVVLLDEGHACKFSQGVLGEYSILKRMYDAHRGETKHVVKLHGEPKSDVALEIEYIRGKTIADMLKDEHHLSSDDVLRYGRDICEGILEMRVAGVYHRDLHDNNVMVTEEADRAVIIDLGCATVNPYETNRLNRAYGGNNDLISLGQMMYKMAVGRNLFNEGDSFTCYSEIKNDVKTVREMTYGRPRRKTVMLNKVKRTIDDAGLAGVIAHLLDGNLWTQPSKDKVEEALKKFDEVGAK